MTTLADRTIAALRTLHDDLETIVAGLSDDQLNGPSGASEWTVAQVLSHLGSGAEIGLGTYEVALDGSPEPGDDHNAAVWARWDSSTPREQANSVLVHDAALVERLEALTPEQRESVEIKLGFVPVPLPVATLAGMRLNEVAQHVWDVRVALDPAATIDDVSAQLLVEHFSGGLGFMLGFVAKADAISEPAVVAIGDSGFSIVIGNQVTVASDAGEPTATLDGATEAATRLLNGRLTSAHTPDDVSVTGNVSLDQLREVFPGY